MSTGSALRPGWYDDGFGARHWWDGYRWTQRVPVAPPPPPPGAGRPPRRRGWLWALLGVLLLIVVVLGGFGLYQLLTPDPDPAQVVMDFDRAYQDKNCSLYMASTTEYFRNNSGVLDCDEFDEAAANFAAYSPYLTQVVDTTEVSAVLVRVRTDESWHDDSIGRDSTSFEYTVTRTDEESRWRIHSIDETDGV